MATLNQRAQYDEYIKDHKANVIKGYKWLCEYLPEVIKDEYAEDISTNIYEHDFTKYEDEEFEPYADYFYGTKTEKVKKDFNYAWLHHLHKNPHHWQHWVLINDEDGTTTLEIPYPYIIEMICDHWSFSWKNNDLTEIFDWYEKHQKSMIINEKSKKTIENILEKIKKKLDKLN